MVCKLYLNKAVNFILRREIFFSRLVASFRHRREKLLLLGSRDDSEKSNVGTQLRAASRAVETDFLNRVTVSLPCPNTSFLLGEPSSSQR
jgi:hypothetical protein